MERRQEERELMHIIAQTLPPPQGRPFWLFGMDATSAPRQFAATLPDRGFVYQPDPLGGNKPVTIGHHQYSVLAFLREKKAAGDAAWIVPVEENRRGGPQGPAWSLGTAIRWSRRARKCPKWPEKRPKRLIVKMLFDARCTPGWLESLPHGHPLKGKGSRVVRSKVIIFGSTGAQKHSE